MSQEKLKTVPRNPNKKAVGGVPAARPGLDVEPKVVLDLSEKMLAQGEGLGVADVARAVQDGIVREVDARISVVAGTGGPQLSRHPTVEAAAGVTGAEILSRRSQLENMSAIYGIVVDVGQDVKDSQRVVGTRARQVRGRLGDLAGRILSGQEPELEAKHPGLRERLMVRWKPVQQAQTKYQEAASARAQETRRETAAGEASVAALGRREDLLRTVLDMKAGRAVEPARAEAAVAAHEEQAAEDAEKTSNRRQRGR